MTELEKRAIKERLAICKFANHPMDEKYIQDVTHLLTALDERDRESVLNKNLLEAQANIIRISQEENQRLRKALEHYAYNCPSCISTGKQWFGNSPEYAQDCPRCTPARIALIGEEKG